MIYPLTEVELNTSQVEKSCREYFGVDLRIKTIILNNAPTSKNTHTTVFKTDRNTIYAFCTADSPLLLVDIKNIIRLMGMKAEAFLPPDADENYFLRFGQKSFQDIFPSRKLSANQETSYYQTLAPYSPALVRISKIDGEIRKYDRTWQQWQSALEFNYQRMQVC